MQFIDLRSDTVTKPDFEMKQAMSIAEVGDDVFRDDPTVIKLEDMAAKLFGKESALFLPSGTQSNLVALLTHCERGDEFIVGQEAHTYLYEGGGGACLGGIQPQPILQNTDGTLDLGIVKSLIKPDDYHFARTKLLCLENTTWGKVLPLDYLAKAGDLARDNNLKIHLDGARVFNASVDQGSSLIDIASPFDSISACLSKGLGAPAGTVLVGSYKFIKEARRWRKVLGGGMRQSGILAAAGIHALKNNINRLAEDHSNAIALADGLNGISDIMVESVSTNMIFITCAEEKRDGIVDCLKSKNILVTGFSGPRLRLVTHKDIDKSSVTLVIEAFKEYFSS